MPKLRVFAGTLSALALALVAAPAAPAATVAKVKKVALIRLQSGTTTITPDPAFVSALQGLGFTPTVLPPGASTAVAYTFPIVTGRLAGNKPAAGYLRHFGGLRLSGSTTHVDLNNFRINDGRTATLTAQVGSGERVALAKLDVTTGAVRLTRKRFGLAGVELLLTDPAATVLNTVLRTTAFTAGTKLGALKVDAKIRLVAKPLKRSSPG